MFLTTPHILYTSTSQKKKKMKRDRKKFDRSRNFQIPSTGCVFSRRITQTNRKTMGHRDSQPTDGSFVWNRGDHWWHNGGQSCVSIERRDPVPRTRDHFAPGPRGVLPLPLPPNTSLEPLDSCFLSLNCQKQWDYCASSGIKGTKRSRDRERERKRNDEEKGWREELGPCQFSSPFRAPRPVELYQCPLSLA